jgi:hypothetical protein
VVFILIRQAFQIFEQVFAAGALTGIVSEIKPIATNFIIIATAFTKFNGNGGLACLLTK